MSEVPNPGDERRQQADDFVLSTPDAQADPAQTASSEPSSQTAPTAPRQEPAPTADQHEGDDAVDKEVAEAMAAMSADDLAELTLGASTSSSSAVPTGVQMGRIAAVRGDDVFVDLGGKTQGVVSKDQFGPNDSLAVGEPIELVIDHFDREANLLVMARKGHARSAEWHLLNPGDIVEGRITGLNRGGLEVQLKGAKAFMPASHVDVAHVKDISIFLNEQITCEVMEIDRRGKSITVSRRKVLEKERAANRKQLLEELEVGQVRKGVVGNLAEFGAFVNLGGVDGLVHISDMSHKQIKHPKDVLKEGDVVEVKVLKIQDDKGKKRISLGIKQTQPDPWATIADKFPMNTTHRVRIVRIADFGAFVELADGIDGLIPVSEMSWGRINKPSEAVEVGQLVDAMVIKIEEDRHRIALSMKQAQPDPWAEVMDSFKPDTKVKGKVSRIVDFGAFVELAPGIEGMIHISEMSDRRIKKCSEVVKVGQEVDARILSVDNDSRRIGLSLKEHSEQQQQPLDLGTSKKPRKKDKKLRGGLAGGWDWAGTGLEDLGG